jgi:diguanylate cyclase
VSEVLELGLRKPGPQPVDQAAALKGLAEAFLKLFSEFSPDAEDADVKQFLDTVEDFRAQIATCDHEQEARRLASGSVRACEQFLRRSRQYFATREAELKEMIGILRQSAQVLAGDSVEFNAQMRATTERFHGFVQLEDIRELKKHLAEETTALQKTVEAKQKRDEEALSALTERVEELRTNLVEAEEQASLDPLTKIANRGAFDKALARAVKKARVSKAPLSLVMLDIDHFKQINDTHGHPIGDRVLLCAAQWLTGAIRQTDLVARYGGEEFAVILSGLDLAATEVRFRAVLEQIASRSFEYQAEGETRSVRFTVSCGITQMAGSDTEADLVQRADQGLYDAKRGGRNRVVAKKRSALGALFR